MIAIADRAARLVVEEAQAVQGALGGEQTIVIAHFGLFRGTQRIVCRASRFDLRRVPELNRRRQGVNRLDHRLPGRDVFDRHPLQPDPIIGGRRAVIDREGLIIQAVAFDLDIGIDRQFRLFGFERRNRVVDPTG